MSPITRALIETAGVAVLAIVGVVLGRWFSRLRSRAWVIGYAVPLLLIAIIGIARWMPHVEQVPPFRWIMADRSEFALAALICTALLTTPLSRLPHKRQRFGVASFMILSAVYFSVLPFLTPALAYGQLSRIETTLDGDGVCLQSNDYTCGPAAAVTALRRLGVSAEEGELAIRAHTSWAAGTPPDSLCAAIRAKYDVACRPAYFHSIRQLRGKEPLIAVVKFSFLVDHYITVLSVTDSEIVVGDPLLGKTKLTHEEFEQKWRKCAIVFEKPPDVDETRHTR